MDVATKLCDHDVVGRLQWEPRTAQPESGPFNDAMRYDWKAERVPSHLDDSVQGVEGARLARTEQASGGIPYTYARSK